MKRKVDRERYKSLVTAKLSLRCNGCGKVYSTKVNQPELYTEEVKKKWMGLCCYKKSKDIIEKRK